jgi:hemoglobin
VSHAFSHGYHPQHSERLAAYWAEALGGPSDYTNSMGDQSGVVRLHSGNGEHVEMDERAQICFAQALDDAGLPDDSRLRSTLKAYFRWATEAMAAYPESPQDVPAGLVLARWSWDGPV